MVQRRHTFACPGPAQSYHADGAMQGIKIAFIAGGPAAVHCIACGMDGRVYTWGRNEKGQLGHGDLVQRNIPTVVEAFAGKYVTAGRSSRFRQWFEQRLNLPGASLVSCSPSHACHSWHLSARVNICLDTYRLASASPSCSVWWPQSQRLCLP